MGSVVVHVDNRARTTLVSTLRYQKTTLLVLTPIATLLAIVGASLFGQTLVPAIALCLPAVYVVVVLGYAVAASFWRARLPSSRVTFSDDDIVVDIAGATRTYRWGNVRIDEQGKRVLVWIGTTKSNAIVLLRGAPAVQRIREMQARANRRTS